MNADAVFINALYVDVNEPINVGQPNNWSVSLPASLDSVIPADLSTFSTITFHLTKGSNSAVVTGTAAALNLLSVGEGVSGTGIPSGTTITDFDSTTNTVTFSSTATQTYNGSLSVWLLNLPASAISAGDAPIPTQYDAITGQIIVSDVSAASGGFISLDGKIINTNTSGELNVNSDLGQVTIDNLTSYPIVVNNVSASKSTTSTTLSGVDIIDTNQPAATEQMLLVYQGGNVIDEYQGTAGQTEQQLEQGSPVAVIQGSSTSYAPEAGLRWQWKLQTTLARSSVPGGLGPWGFASSLVDGENNNNNPWYYLDANDKPTAADSTGTTSTPFGQLVTKSDSDPAFEESISGTVQNWFAILVHLRQRAIRRRPDRPAGEG